MVVVGDGGHTAVRQFNDLKGIVGLEFRVIHYDGTSAIATESTTETLDLGEQREMDPSGSPEFPETNVLGNACLPFSIHQPDTQQSAMFGVFQFDVLNRFGSGLIWLETGSHSLVEEVVTETSSHFGEWLLAIPCCGAGNRGFKNSADLCDLATRIGFSGSPIDKTNGTHRFRTFESAAGMSLVVPSHLCVPQNSRAPNDNSSS